MNIKDFTEPQQQALLDLAALAMYADGHLASKEDERVLRLLGAMGFDSDYDRRRHYDAAVTRVSRHSQTADSARAYALTLSQAFSTREQRQAVEKILDEIVTSDRHVSDPENNFLSLVSEALQK
ncbi:MAG: TerB family tellurite resistance protein [Chitinophagaceae bacterium]|nr:TerB family tellurite resistance protein [Chitinophagaceae bacterium]